MRINLKKGDYATKRVKIGFSWTVFLFGGLPLLFRGMYRHFFIVLVTLGLASLYYMFTANKIYLEKLLAEGWELGDDAAKSAITSISSE